MFTVRFRIVNDADLIDLENKHLTDVRFFSNDTFLLSFTFCSLTVLIMPVRSHKESMVLAFLLGFWLFLDRMIFIIS
jgi:hypothetical protein